MRVMLDTNVFISAILFPDSQPFKAIEKVIMNYTLVLCSQIIEKLYEIFKRKFKDKINLLDRFLFKLSYEYIHSPVDINEEDYPGIRDKVDLPILATAILGEVDIIITGDKDFFDIKIEKCKIMTPEEFVERFYGI